MGNSPASFQPLSVKTLKKLDFQPSPPILDFLFNIKHILTKASERYYALRDQVQGQEPPMKFSSTEEYGLRCMLQMAKKGPEGTTTIVELAQKEALTPAYVAKIMSVLRRGNLVKSIRGQSGGYRLARPSSEINVNDVVEALGGKFFSKEEYCADATPGHLACLHSMDCAIRSLWTGLDAAITGYLRKCRLSDLVCSEKDMEKWVSQAQARAFVPLAQTGLQDKVKEGMKAP